ncbi:hypothetical protein A9Q99_13160 [Gammaproteobacteria bacterium 45_16_T64]|nr:hypothetical protein A9Q99_13160 [Gammaproteobacteria bacterium 45_16_T64]
MPPFLFVLPVGPNDVIVTVGCMQTSILTDADLAQLLSNSSLLEGGADAPKVLLTNDGYIYKLFYRPKRKLSSRALFSPYKLFIKNSQELQRRNVPSVTVCKTMVAEDGRFNALRYRAVDGIEFRDHVSDVGNGGISTLVDIMVELHQQGVFFRAIHLGNILRQSDGHYALIDISDCWFSWGALDAFRRARNLAHLLNYRADKPYFLEYGYAKFINEYAVRAKLGKVSTWFITSYIRYKGVEL